MPTLDTLDKDQLLPEESFDQPNQDTNQLNLSELSSTIINHIKAFKY
jgi:hypothetical protein